MGRRVLGFCLGFRILGFDLGFRVLGFGLEFWFTVSSFGFRDLIVGFRVWGLGFALMLGVLA